MQPKLRSNHHEVGGIPKAIGGNIPVSSEKVEEVVHLLIDSLPSVIHTGEVYSYGQFNLSFCKRVRVRVRFIERNTKCTNAAIRYRNLEGFTIRFYPAGLNERTIIHEVAHIPSWGAKRSHGPVFKFWQEYFQSQWYGVKKGG